MTAPTESPISYLAATFLGLLQGVAEFLPISSSGHLALAQNFMGLEDLPVFFDLMLHVGTLAAVTWYYRHALPGAPADPADDLPNLRDRRTFLMVCVWMALALAPAIVAKLVFKETKPGATATALSKIGDMREQASQRPRLVLSFLALTSVVLLVASRASPGTVGVAQTTAAHALLIGCAQALSALCPGLSRSGMTISTALLLGFSATWAVNFSLLLSIPTILAASVWEARHLTIDWVKLNWAPTLWGTIVAAVVGWLSIQLLARSVQRRQWGMFAGYLWLVILVAGPFVWMRSSS